MRSLLATLVAMIAAPSFGAGLAPGEMTGYSQAVCNDARTKCIDLQAEKADSTALRPLFTLKNVRVQMHGPHGERVVVMQAQNGYIDFGLNQLVLTMGSGPSQFDRMVDLRSMQMRDLR